MYRHQLAISVLCAATLSGCLATTGGGSGAAAPQGQSAGAAAATVVKLEVDREKNFGDSPTIVVPTLYLRLPVEGRVAVSQQGSALRAVGRGNTNTVKASANFKVNGLDKALAQGIAKKAYDDFVGKLRAAGYRVLTWDDIKDQDAMKGADRLAVDATYGLPVEDGHLVVSPSDAQNIKRGMTGSPFLSMGKSALKEGTILIPQYTITAPQAWGEKGGGVDSISAGVNLAPSMNLQSAIVALNTHGGGWGSAKLTAPVFISESTGTLAKTEDTSPGAANAVSTGLSFLSGAGKISKSSANYSFTVDRKAYEEGALKGLGQFHDEVVKVAAAARK